MHWEAWVELLKYKVEAELLEYKKYLENIHHKLAVFSFILLTLLTL